MTTPKTTTGATTEAHPCPLCERECRCPEPDDCIGCWDCAEAREHAGEDTY